jgi:formate dehydrogenase major subunit
VVLPAAYWAEKEGSVTATERRVQWLSKAIEPMNNSRADWQIIGDVARKLGFNFRYNSPEEILHEINEVIPSYRGITPERLKKKVGGLQWPCPTPEHPGTPILHVEKFATKDGLARMIPVEYRPPLEKTSDEYPLALTTGRMVIHYNSGTMTRRSPSLLKRSPEPYVEINPADAKALGITNNEEVKVITRRGEVTVKAAVTNNVPPGLVFTHFHFPGLNVLTRHDLDPVAKVPEYKYAACRVEKRG